MSEGFKDLKAVAARNPVVCCVGGLLFLAAIIKLMPDTGASSGEQTRSAQSTTSSASRVAPKLVDSGTKCATAIQDFDSKDRRKMFAVDKYVQDVMQDEERLHVVRGERVMLARMNSEGFVTMRAMAIEYCRQDPSSSLRDAAVEAYNGTRGLQDELGAR